MNIFTAIISALFFGALIGVLARLILPGKQDLSWGKTIGIGVVAAFLGTVVAAIFGVAETDGIDWIQWALQIGFAIVGVLFLSGTSFAKK